MFQNRSILQQVHLVEMDEKIKWNYLQKRCDICAKT